jgi:hypothetical protein
MGTGACYLPKRLKKAQKMAFAALLAIFFGVVSGPALARPGAQAPVPSAAPTSAASAPISEPQRLERAFERACPRLFAAAPRLRIDDEAQRTQVCACAVSLSVTDAVVKAAQEPQQLYDILAANYLSCGERHIKRGLRAAREKGAEPKPTERQMACLVDMDFEFAQLAAASQARPTEASVNARTQGCMRLQ